MQNIDTIMQELGLDPSDKVARKTIERLIAARPHAQIDEQFLSLLRQDLQTHAAAMPAPKQTNMFTGFMNKILASALVIMVVVVAGGIWYIQGTNRPLFETPQSTADQILSGKYAVTSLENESFGELDKVAISPSGRGGSAAQGGDMAMTGSGNNAATSESAKLIAPGEPDRTSLPYPGGEVYTFKYEGDALTNLPQTQDVLKRQKPQQPSGLVSRIVSFLSFGLVDLSKFQDVRMQTISFTEDREMGYGLNVDLNMGMVNIYQNYERWPQPQYICERDYCGPQPRIKPEDIPADDEVIRIAAQFIADYGISKEGYGVPQVNNQWRVHYDLAADKSSYYIPEQVNVVYPLQLEGKQVYDEGGYLNGLNISVDIRNKRVVNVYELTTKQFEKSQYVGETNSKRLVDVAERGGFRNYIYDYAGARKVQLRLDTPTVEMVKIWYSTDNYRTQNELYVPALVFPIKNAKQTNYWRQNVIVPLVKDILDSDKEQPINILPVEDTVAPKPADTPAVEPAAPVSNLRAE